jgi:hypothetical protein
MKCSKRHSLNFDRKQKEKKIKCAEEDNGRILFLNVTTNPVLNVKGIPKNMSLMMY